MRIRQSICYPLFLPEDMSLASLCEAASQIGYAAIELWHREDHLDEVVKLARQHDLAVASMSGHYSLEEGLNDPQQHDRIHDEIVASIDLAARHGIPGLICFSGNRRHGQSDYEGMVACARGLRRVAGYAQKKRVNLNVEVLNSKVDHPGYLADRTDWGIALCEMVNSPRVKLLYDIYHMQIMEGDVIRSIRKVIGHIGHFHTAGNPGRHELDDNQELNYTGICRAIADTGYDLYVGHEFSSRGDPVDSLRATFAVCDQG